MVDESLFSYLPPANAEKNAMVLESGLNALKLASEEGVTLCYGSDLLKPLGRYQILEFEVKSRVLSAVEILKSATANPARMMGLADVGQIQKGYQAGMVILKSNPLEDIKVLSRPETEIVAVFTEGKLCRGDTTDLVYLMLAPNYNLPSYHNTRCSLKYLNFCSYDIILAIYSVRCRTTTTIRNTH